jgi:hypothetical protein
VLFINDSLLTKHAGGAILGRVLRSDALLRQLRVPAIAGKLDPYRSICLRNPWSGHAGYVSSFCFLLNGHALPVLRSLRRLASDDGVLATSPVQSDLWGTGLQPAMREFIRAHLVYHGSPYLWNANGAADASLVRKKASCVYFESRLSGAIGADGALVPINAGPRSRTGLFVSETLSRLARAITGA